MPEDIFILAALLSEVTKLPTEEAYSEEAPESSNVKKTEGAENHSITFLQSAVNYARRLLP
jgi:hypothetical protein